MPRVQRRQDPDHDELGAQVLGLRPGAREQVEQFVFQLAPLVAGQRARREVQLEVPAAELGLPLAGADRVQDVGPVERRRQLRTDQVELDLHAGHRLRVGERVAAEEVTESVQTALHLIRYRWRSRRLNVVRSTT